MGYDYSKRKNCFFKAQDPSLPKLSTADLASFFAKENELRDCVTDLSVIQNRLENYQWQLSKLEDMAKQRPLSAEQVKIKKALENHLKTIPAEIESSNLIAKIEGLYQELESYYPSSRPGPGG